MDRILVVEDNEDLASIVCEILRSSGHEARVALDASAAMATAADFRPHAVLLDLGLPDADGCDVARQLRLLPDGAAMRIIALSGWNRPEDIARAIAAGCDAHLLKPVGIVELRAALAS